MIVAGSIALLLFTISYIRPGRYGLTVLAMSAGYVLAEFWASTLAGTYRPQADFGFLPWHDAVYSTFVVIPGLLVLLLAHKQQGIVPRIPASLALALLTVTLLLPIFASNFAAGTQVVSVLAFLQEYRQIIFTVIVVLGLGDVLLSRPSKARKHSKD